MNDFINRKCGPCQGGVATLNENEINNYLKNIKHWQVIDNHHLEKKYTFKDFKSSLSFVNKVGDLAELENHHPNIYFTWGKVVITIWTHKINGLHENDFIFKKSYTVEYSSELHEK